MSQNRIDGDTYVNGNLTSKTFTAPAGSIGDAGIQGAAAIQATKLDHQHQDLVCQVHGSAATTERRVIKTVRGATAEIVSFRAGVVVACIGAATISIRLKKNGTNIDTAALVIDNTNTAFAFESAAGFTSTSLVANDVLEVDVTATAGGGTLGQGLYMELTTRERAN